MRRKVVKNLHVHEIWGRKIKIWILQIAFHNFVQIFPFAQRSKTEKTKKSIQKIRFPSIKIFCIFAFRVKKKRKRKKKKQFFQLSSKFSVLRLSNVFFFSKCVYIYKTDRKKIRRIEILFSSFAVISYYILNESYVCTQNEYKIDR